ncbi:hypothetical protein [Psychrobacter sp. 78a-MNA-CIBAN-0178]|uniref:hypothetical protein n=1 Tax=Psychrobacter sp. 78a-MNA-CIBAN-0178 TaxID=3140450 RepID=UPI00331F6E92|tara:strand:- start:1093 stop:2292 length:1200 start_codon:yes stop_codon:yes gene_type:complete
MQCILHIGTEKTGTTVLQNWLYYNKDKLSENRVYLSNFLGKPNNRLLVCYFMDHFDDWFRTKGIDTQHEKDVFFKNFRQELCSEINEASKNHDYMIITSEHFHSRLVNADSIVKLKNFLYQVFENVKVICYFREQSAMRQSLYSTALKVSSVDNFKEFQQDISETTYYYNFYEIANRWSDIFGLGNCIFKVYDRERFLNSDLRMDFINSINIGVHYKDLCYDLNGANESLSFIEGVLYRKINASIPLFNSSGKGINTQNGHLKSIVSNCDKIKLGRFNDELSSEISERFKSSNKRFFDKYFDGKYLFKAPATTQDIDLNEKCVPITEVALMLEDLLSGILGYEYMNLKDSDANILRDIALKYDENIRLSKQDACYLMMLAQRARPNGEFISNKVKEYSS